MELREALSQISEIHQQMARSEVFRGYRSMTVGFSGILGFVAAAIQPQWVASPESEIDRYLCLWIAVAALSLIITAAEMYWSARGAGTGLARRMTLLAVEQFPCVWPRHFRFLPAVASPGVLGRPLLCLLWLRLVTVGQGDNALSPWLMGIRFGGGQLLGAAILYWTLERDDVSSTNV